MSTLGGIICVGFLAAVIALSGLLVGLLATGAMFGAGLWALGEVLDSADHRQPRQR